MVKLSGEKGTVERYKRSLVEFWLFLINSLSMYGTRNTSCIVLELTTSQFCKLALSDNIILKLYISSAMQKSLVSAIFCGQTFCCIIWFLFARLCFTFVLGKYNLHPIDDKEIWKLLASFSPPNSMAKLHSKLRY